MSTITTKRQDATVMLPEWRRICHRYVDDSQISVCGTARRKPGHTVCVVCEEFVAAMGFSE
jgi:hypothetical protein